MSDQKQTSQNINWNNVESALNEGTVSGYKMAIIETEKIFSIMLEEKGFLGKDPAKQLRKARHVFKNPEKIERAGAMYKKIIRQPGFGISSEDTKEIIGSLHEGILELEKLNGHKKGIAGAFLKIERKINLFYQETIKKWFFIFAIFCFAVLFLSKTKPGNWITSQTISFVSFITFKIAVPAGLAVLAVYALIMGIKYFRQK